MKHSNKQIVDQYNSDNGFWDEEPEAAMGQSYDDFLDEVGERPEINVPTGRDEFSSEDFITDRNQRNRLTRDYQEFDVHRACSESELEYIHDQTQSGTTLPILVNGFFGLFYEAVCRPQTRADKRDQQAKKQTSQLAFARMFGLSDEDLAAIEGDAKRESANESMRLKQEKLESGKDEFVSDPTYTATRLRLAKAFSVANIFDYDVPAELGKLMLKKRALANAMATQGAYDKSREYNEELKVIFSTANGARRSVAYAVAKAIAIAIFERTEYNEDFRHEGKTYRINKKADDEAVEGLWSEGNIFAGHHPANIRASFNTFKESLDPIWLGLVGLRADMRYDGINVEVEVPDNYDALIHDRNEGTVDRSQTTIVYRAFDLEGEVAEEIVKLKVRFAIEAKAAEFLGASDGHADTAVDF